MDRSTADNGTGRREWLTDDDGLDADATADTKLIHVQAMEMSTSVHMHTRSTRISSRYESENVSLLQAQYQAIPMKDFSTEVRASRDVQDFLQSMILLTDVHENNIEAIVDKMVKKLLDEKKEVFKLEDAKNFLFARDSESLFSNTIQGAFSSDEDGFDFDHSWICAMCEMPTLTKRHVVLARLRHPANFGPTMNEVSFITLVLAPSKEKSTKNMYETGRTFATLFTDMEFRHQLLDAHHTEDFVRHFQQRVKSLSDFQTLPENRKSQPLLSVFDEDEKEQQQCFIGRGMMSDLKRRLPHYFSDFKDGIFGHKTPHKVTAATLFLYFACVLPNLAFGMLNSNNTHGAIGVKKILFSQSVGGIIFALFGGQPLIVLLTTAPLALYTKIIYSICQDFDLDFYAMFACVGLWNSFFLFIYCFFNVSKMMKWSTRSTEEVFSIFITFAFAADAIRDTVKDFNVNYYNKACDAMATDVSTFFNSTLHNNVTTTMLPATMTTLRNNVTEIITNNMTLDTNLTGLTNATLHPENEVCLKENSILFVLLMLGTVWVGITLFNFTKTPFLNSSKREMLADYALPVAVIIMSFFGSFVFRHVKLQPFEYDPNEAMFILAPIHKLPVGAIFAAAGLGFSLSLLFFMDQNISSALVNTPANKLKKGAAYHWDLFVVAVINVFLSVFTFPWVHAALPHSPLHVRALADVEERVEQGHVKQVVIHVRENRLSGVISHVLIGLSTFLLPYPMAYIPRAVLDGLFIYVAITALYGNEMFDRILLLFTEQAAYPPNHYVRRVPQRKVHLFTGIQLLQLLVLLVFGFSPFPYMKMIFPILLMFLMPIRHKLVPRIIEPKYLKALDGH